MDGVRGGGEEGCDVVGGDLPLVSAFRKMAAPSDLSSSSLWCCASAGCGSPRERRDAMWLRRVVMS